MNQNKTVRMTRVFNAPREKVWQMWTDPQHFSQWWCPDGFTIPVCELDVHPGGKLRVDMQGPDGTIYPSVGEYREVIAPEKLVFTNSPLDANGNALFEVLHSVELREQDGQTQLNIVSTVLSATPEAAPYLAGMEPGIDQSVAKLARLL